MGHWKKNCFYNPENPLNKLGDKGKGGKAQQCKKPLKKKTLHAIENGTDEFEEYEEQSLYIAALPTASAQPLHSGSSRIRVGVDSGAAATAVPDSLFKDYPKTDKADQVCCTATGHKIKDGGQVKLLGRLVQLPRGAQLPLHGLAVEQVAEQELVLGQRVLGEDQSRRPLDLVVQRQRLATLDGIQHTRRLLSCSPPARPSCRPFPRPRRPAVNVHELADEGVVHEPHFQVTQERL